MQVFPPENLVKAGVKYGPTGKEFTGTMVLVESNINIDSIATAVWNHNLALSLTRFLSVK